MGMLPIKVGFCTSEKSYHKTMERYGVEMPEAFISIGKDATVHSFDSENGLIAIFCIRGKQKNGIDRNQITSLIIHESVHIWQKAKETMGVTLNDTEIEAYAIQWISQQFLNAYYK